jgi:DNA-binding NarL/FixJ family response regulator
MTSPATTHLAGSPRAFPAARPGPFSPALAAAYPSPAYPPPLAAPRADPLHRAAPRADPIQRLTGRQSEVLALIAEGLSNAAIARLLSITERAVVRHISNIYDQLDLPVSDDEHRRVRAVLCYIAR